MPRPVKITQQRLITGQIPDTRRFDEASAVGSITNSLSQIGDTIAQRSVENYRIRIDSSVRKNIDRITKENASDPGQMQTALEDYRSRVLDTLELPGLDAEIDRKISILSAPKIDAAFRTKSRNTNNQLQTDAFKLSNQISNGISESVPGMLSEDEEERTISGFAVLENIKELSILSSKLDSDGEFLFPPSTRVRIEQSANDAVLNSLLDISNLDNFQQINDMVQNQKLDIQFINESGKKVSKNILDNVDTNKKAMFFNRLQSKVSGLRTEQRKQINLLRKNPKEAALSVGVESNDLQSVINFQVDSGVLPENIRLMTDNEASDISDALNNVQTFEEFIARRQKFRSDFGDSVLLPDGSTGSSERVQGLATRELIRQGNLQPHAVLSLQLKPKIPAHNKAGVELFNFAKSPKETTDLAKQLIRTQGRNFSDDIEIPINERLEKHLNVLAIEGKSFDVINNIRKGAVDIATSVIARGGNVGEAIDIATDWIVGDYEVVQGINDSMYRIPTENLDENDMDLIENWVNNSAADKVLETINQESVPASLKQSSTKNLVRDSVSFIGNNNNTGIAVFASPGVPAMETVTIIDESGKKVEKIQQIEFTFEEILQFAKDIRAQRAGRITSGPLGGLGVGRSFDPRTSDPEKNKKKQQKNPEPLSIFEDRLKSL